MEEIRPRRKWPLLDDSFTLGSEEFRIFLLFLLNVSLAPIPHAAYNVSLIYDVERTNAAKGSSEIFVLVPTHLYAACSIYALNMSHHTI